MGKLTFNDWTFEGSTDECLAFFAHATKEPNKPLEPLPTSEKVQCPKCGTKLSRSGLYHHLHSSTSPCSTTLHKEKDNPKVKPTKPKSGKSRKYERNSEGQFICPNKCGKTFSSSSALIYHTKHATVKCTPKNDSETNIKNELSKFQLTSPATPTPPPLSLSESGISSAVTASLKCEAEIFTQDAELIERVINKASWQQEVQQIQKLTRLIGFENFPELCRLVNGTTKEAIINGKFYFQKFKNNIAMVTVYDANPDGNPKANMLFYGNISITEVNKLKRGIGF